MFGSVSCCKLLLEKNANINSQNSDKIYHLNRIPVYSGGGRTPLMTAVLKDETDTIGFLMDSGADLNITDNDGRTAYDLACRHSKLKMAPILNPQAKEHLFINEPIDIPKPIIERVQKRQEEEKLQYQNQIYNIYKPKEINPFNESCFVDSFLNAINKNTKEGYMEILQEVSPRIYKFEMFKPEFCDYFLDELKLAEAKLLQQKIPIHRPNSMNNYGIIIDELGYRSAIESLMKKYVLPISSLFYSDFYGSSLDKHHCFLVRYKPGEDLDLALHIDDAEVTLNVCLGKAFTGGTLNFYGIKDTPDQHQLNITIEHKKGVALLHLGTHYHEANKIEDGERCNLILWCRSSLFKPWLKNRRK
jgi:hypothetical protein